MQTLPVLTTQDFRKWLEKHHTSEEKVAVVLYKKHTGKTAPRAAALMREAICFGWIDTTAKRIDEDRWMIRYTRRTPASKWSDNTLRYARELIAEGNMSPQGLHYYTLGKAKPVHDAHIPKKLTILPELAAALKNDKILSDRFTALSPSARKMFLRWIWGAKLPPTRAKRITKTLEALKDNRKSVF